jgi:MYXO-CTERM domain-containing protein
MSVQKLFAIPTVILSLALTFAPVFAQDAGNNRSNAANDNRATAVRADDHDRAPNLGWLGLIGLIGLGGLMRRDRYNDANRGRPSHT